MTGNTSKGGVTTASSEESGTRFKEATRVAGRMLQSGKIDVHELSAKIAELQRYESEQIKDFEKNIFAHQGLNTAPDGEEQALVVNEASNGRNSQDHLADRLVKMFSLNRKNEAAQSDSDIELRKTFGR